MNKNYITQYKHIKRDRRGITMMETVVAIGILILGVITALTLMISSLSFSQSSEQSIVVVNLAREGLEITRSIRDLKGFSSLDLTTGDKIPFIDPRPGYEFLMLSNTGESDITQCDTCVLHLCSGRYVHNYLWAKGCDTKPIPGNQTTPFRRMIIISDESANEKKIISKVYWTEHGRAHTFILEDHLTDW